MLTPKEFLIYLFFKMAPYWKPWSFIVCRSGCLISDQGVPLIRTSALLTAGTWNPGIILYGRRVHFWHLVISGQYTFGHSRRGPLFICSGFLNNGSNIFGIWFWGKGRCACYDFFCAPIKSVALALISFQPPIFAWKRPMLDENNLSPFILILSFNLLPILVEQV